MIDPERNGHCIKILPTSWKVAPPEVLKNTICGCKSELMYTIYLSAEFYKDLN